MGTHCYIAKKIGADKYQTIFCQLDGYLEEVGAKLAGYYDTEQKLDKLLALGDVFSLRAKLDPIPGKKHDLMNSQEGVTLFYGRDFHEKDMEATVKTMADLESDDDRTEFVYIFDPEKGWEYFHSGQSREGLRNLKEVLDRMGIEYAPEEQGNSGEEETYEQKM